MMKYENEPHEEQTKVNGVISQLKIYNSKPREPMLRTLF